MQLTHLGGQLLSPGCGIQATSSRFHTASPLRAYAWSRLVRQQETNAHPRITSIPPFQPLDGGSTDEPTAALRGVSLVKTAAAIAAAAAVLSFSSSSSPASSAPDGRQLPRGRARPGEGRGTDGAHSRSGMTRINAEGYTVSHYASVSVVSEDGRRPVAQPCPRLRETDFGSETIVVDGARTEKFLTVTERQGGKRPGAGACHPPRPSPRRRRRRRLPRQGEQPRHEPVIDPVQILDRSGKEITPEGLSWELEEAGLGWWLTLDLDDSDLPVPYVIDLGGQLPHFQTANNGAGLDQPQ